MVSVIGKTILFFFLCLTGKTNKKWNRFSILKTKNIKNVPLLYEFIPKPAPDSIAFHSIPSSLLAVPETGIIAYTPSETPKIASGNNIFIGCNF